MSQLGQLLNWAKQLFVVEGCLHFNMLCSIPGLCPLANSCDNQKCPQTLPSVPEGKKSTG